MKKPIVMSAAMSIHSGPLRFNPYTISPSSVGIMNRIVAGARRDLNTLSDIHPHRIVPGTADHSKSAQARLDSLKVKPFAVCK